VVVVVVAGPVVLVLVLGGRLVVVVVAGSVVVVVAWLVVVVVMVVATVEVVDDGVDVVLGVAAEVLVPGSPVAPVHAVSRSTAIRARRMSPSRFECRGLALRRTRSPGPGRFPG
jgi:hypothetical protein